MPLMVSHESISDVIICNMYICKCWLTFENKLLTYLLNIMMFCYLKNNTILCIDTIGENTIIGVYSTCITCSNCKLMSSGHNDCKATDSGGAASMSWSTRCRHSMAEYNGPVVMYLYIINNMRKMESFMIPLWELGSAGRQLIAMLALQFLFVFSDFL